MSKNIENVRNKLNYNAQKKIVLLFMDEGLIEGMVKNMQAKVKWFNNEKGYGFIEYTDKEDIFVHYSAIRQDGYKSLEENQTVEFELVETEKGFQAVNVTLAKELAITK